MKKILCVPLFDVESHPLYLKASDIENKDYIVRYTV